MTKYLIDNGLKLDMEKLSKYKLYTTIEYEWKDLDAKVKRASTFGNLDDLKCELSDFDVLILIQYMLDKIREVDSWPGNDDPERICDIKKCIDYLENTYNIKTSNYDIYAFMKNVRLSKLT